jgi:hypothetical protein
VGKAATTAAGLARRLQRLRNKGQLIGPANERIVAEASRLSARLLSLKLSPFCLGR